MGYGREENLKIRSPRAKQIPKPQKIKVTRGGVAWTGVQEPLGEGAVVTVLGTTGTHNTKGYNAAIDGFTISGGDQNGFPGNYLTMPALWRALSRLVHVTRSAVRPLVSPDDTRSLGSPPRRSAFPAAEEAAA